MAEANNVDREFGGALSEVRQCREIYEDVLCATFTWAPRGFYSRANSIAGSQRSKSSHGS